MDSERTSRTTALLGGEAVRKLAESHVAVIGVGGVGGWCAEALARTGIGTLTLVDDDLVAESNLNRQVAATAATIGMQKTEAMKSRIESVNPDCTVRAFQVRYPDAAVTLTDCDLVIDAIDSVDCKAQLILDCTDLGIPVLSSMGAALRCDPTKITVSEFGKVCGDGLARALRNRFKRLQRDNTNFRCVWSAENPIRSAVRGSMMPVTCTFGMCLAAEAIGMLIRQ